MWQDSFESGGRKALQLGLGAGTGSGGEGWLDGVSNMMGLRAFTVMSRDGPGAAV